MDSNDHSELFEFAKRARQSYMEKVGPLVYPILRFDIMQYSGKMVVNEYESLEAMIFSGSRGSALKTIEDAHTEPFLHQFWISELSRIVGVQHIKKRKLC